MKRILVYIIGQQPPPIGGVTIHTQRLAGWLKESSNINVVSILPNKLGLIRYMALSFFSRKGKVVTHCQTSSVYGLILVILSRSIFRTKNKVVYSIHSEYWVGNNLSKKSFKSRVCIYCIKKADLIICDNENIASQFSKYTDKTQLIVPFLPPIGDISKGFLHEYLNMSNFDSPVLTFNAYKLAYNKDGEDVYGINTLLKAFLSLTEPLTLLLLIPQLSEEEQKNINESVNKSNNSTNKERIHIVCDESLEGWKIIAKSDMFVRPTITDGDALSLREALYYNTPVIASDCTIRPEGVTLFKTGDALDLAEKIKYLSSNLKKEVVLKKNNNKYVPSDFINAYVSLYN